MINYRKVKINSTNFFTFNKESESPNFTKSLNKQTLLMRRSKLLLLVPALAILSCTKDSDEELNELELTEASETTDVVETQSMTEVANPETPTSVSEVYYAGQKVPVEEFEGDYIFQGDIILSRDMVSTAPQKLVYEKGETPTQKSTGRTSGRWPNNTVYYSIASNLTNKKRVEDAIKHWEDNTNLKFVERSNQPNYIYFVSGSGCSSYVGMVGGKQDITLSSSCSTGNTIHEIGHAIGLWHEQSRVDRDSYIKVNNANIQSGREQNFYTYESTGLAGDEYTNSLDFQSIMLYGSYAFSKNGQPTMVKKDGSTFSGQRSGLSSGDKTGVNNMYPYTSGSSSESSSSSEKVDEVYVNGQYYTLYGLTVFRTRDNWYYKSKIGWRTVFHRNDTWYYK